MAKGFTKVEIIVVVIVIALLIGGDIFLYTYLNNKNRDLTVISEVEQIKSGLDLFYAYSRYYPIKSDRIMLNSDYQGTQILCQNGFNKLKNGCDKLIMKIPNYYYNQGNRYTYKTDAAGQDYEIEFVLTHNYKPLNLLKGANCLVTGQILAQPCSP